MLPSAMIFAVFMFPVVSLAATYFMANFMTKVAINKKSTLR